MITYREDFKLYWPDFDQKAERNFDFITKHLVDMDYAISKSRKGVCVQAGGNVGIWPIKLAKHFQVVHTFEPEEALFECMLKNIKVENVFSYPYALSDQKGTVKFHRSSSCGSNRVTPDGKLTVHTTTIDSLDLKACDAIFLDIEGHELAAIRGALQTIEKFGPVIQVEWLKHYECELLEIDRLLLARGYKARVKSGRDMVYVK